MKNKMLGMVILIFVSMIIFLSCAITGINGENIDPEKSKVTSDSPYIPIMNTKVIEIGGWNMITTSRVNIPHGLNDHQKIRSVQCLIRRDDQYSIYPLNWNCGLPAGNIQSITPQYIELVRMVNGVWDSIDYDSTSFNRGWVTIWYEE